MEAGGGGGQKKEGGGAPRFFGGVKLGGVGVFRMRFQYALQRCAIPRRHHSERPILFGSNRVSHLDHSRGSLGNTNSKNDRIQPG